MPKGLGDLGVTDADIPRLAQLTLGDACLTTNPRPASVDRGRGAVPGGPVVTTPCRAVGPPPRGRPAPVAATRTWTPRRAAPDLDALTGLRSGKPHYFPEHRTYAERLRRVISALERISAALMRTTEGSEALVRAVVEAAAEHLCADWVVFALVDGELAESRPRHLVRGPDGAEWTDVRAVPDEVREHLLAVLHGAADDDAGHDAEAHRRHVHVPVRLDGRVVGGFVAWTPAEPGGRRHRPLRARHPRRPDRRGAAELRAARPLGPAARPDHPPGRRPGQAPRRAAGHPGRAGRRAPARGARLRTPPHRARAPRQRHPVRALGGHAHRAGPHGGRRPPPAHPPRHRQGPHAPGRRAAAVGDLRAAPRRGRGRRGPAVDAAPALGRAHAGRAAGRGAHRRRAGAAARRSASSRCSGSRARRCSTPPCTPTRAGRWCGWPTAAAGSG